MVRTGGAKTWTNRYDRFASRHVATKPAGPADRDRDRRDRRIRARPTPTPGARPERIPTTAASARPERPSPAAAGLGHPAFDRDRMGQGRLHRNRGHALADRPIG